MQPAFGQAFHQHNVSSHPWTMKSMLMQQGMPRSVYLEQAFAKSTRGCYHGLPFAGQPATKAPQSSTVGYYLTLIKVICFFRSTSGGSTRREIERGSVWMWMCMSTKIQSA